MRRSFATTVAALLLATPLLSSCGFDLGTDRVSDNTVGIDDRSGTVDILAAVVVAAQQGSGTFIATLSNKDETDQIDFESLLGAEGNTIVADDFDPLTIAPRGLVNMADGGGVKITGSFGAGDVIPLTLGFSDGEKIAVEVPVVSACEEYLDLDPSASPSPTASPSATGPAIGSATASSTGSSASASPSKAAPSSSASASTGTASEVQTVTPTSTPTVSGSAEPSEEASASSDAYSCDYAPSQE